MSEQDLFASRYRLLGVIGEGAMGVVWRAHDTVLDRPVAIKEMRPRLGPDQAEIVSRFLAEARAAARLGHPNVVAVHDVFTELDRVVIAMELLDGCTLDRLVAAEGAQPASTVRAIMSQVAQGLAAAHSAGVIHRDLKPDNIFWTTEGRAVIADFGLARIGLGVGTIDGTVMGTPGYMAPEQVRGTTAGPAADVFAWGVVARMLAAGRPPFGDPDESDPAALPYRIIHQQLPPLDLPEDMTLARLVDECLAKDSTQRPADGRALTTRLAGDEHDAGPVPAVHPPAVTSRRQAWIVAAVAATVLAITIAAVLATRGPGSPERAAPAPTVLSTTTVTTPSTTTTPPTTVAAPRPLPVGGGPIAAGAWVPTELRPQISFRLGEGWEIDGPMESTDHLFLIRRPPEPSYPWLLFVQVHRLFDYRDPTIVRDATGDVAEWLRLHPRLSVRQLTSTTVAGRPVVVIDAVVSSAYENPSCNRSCVLLFKLDSNFDVRLHDGDRLRAYVIDAGDRQLVVVVEAPAQEFDSLVRTAEGVVQSVKLG